MVLVMMGNGSNRLESDLRNDTVQDGAADIPSVVPVDGVGGNEDEKRSSKTNSFDVIEKVQNPISSEEEAKVSSNDDDIHNHKDKIISHVNMERKGSDVVRVPDEGAVFPVSEMRRENENTNVNDDQLSNYDSGNKEMQDKGEEKGEVFELVGEELKRGNGKLGRKKPRVSDYNSMLSMFDEFAQNGNRWNVGYGYEIGDMVWGKVKSHPWWPGHIYNEAFASHSVRRSKTDGHVLVAFFGDSSYGWFDLAELIPFEPNYAEKSRQTNSRNFVKAVEEAVDEVSRRSALGVACRCRNPYNFRPTNVEGFFAVDVSDYEPGELFSASQIKKARDSFQPWEMLAFMKQLASKPRSGHENINFIKRQASALAYRKAVFEEFDETYAQAFGAQLVRPERKAAADISREPSRAHLSGPLVIAETLGKGKASGRPAKAKDQTEKERYLFKRRDEPTGLREQKSSKSGSSAHHIQHDRSISGKCTYPLVADQLPCSIGSNVADAFQQSSGLLVPLKARGHDASHPLAGDPKLQDEGFGQQTEVGPKKVRVQKRSAGELISKDSLSLEKKKKKKRKELGMQTSLDQVPTVAGKVGASVVKVAGEVVQVAPAIKVDSKMESQGKDLVGNLIEVSSAAEGDSNMENQKKDVAASASLLLSQQTVGVRNTEQLQQMLNDLGALALNPFHGAERSCPLILQKVFLKFRSLVYQKSLVPLEPAEAELSEAHTGKLSAIAVVSDDPTVEAAKEMLYRKPQKPIVKPEDPTIGGRKRGPSDRQEEMAAKKKKKVNDLKSLAAEKKAAWKTTETPRGDTREMPVKPTVPTPKPVKPEAVKKTGLVVKAPDPTMLIMKFPPGGALPSLGELKAKFARFGPLDPNKIRVYWQSSQCRLVYQHKSHAEAALKFATGSNSPFGNSKVRCYLRDLSVEMPELESAKVQREDNASIGASLSKEPGVEQRRSTKLASQPSLLPHQLKSCLKKPSGDEGGSVNGVNSGGRVARVKFMLGGEGSSRSEQLPVGNRNLDNASISDGGTSSSSHPTMEFNSKIFQRIISPSESSSRFPLSSPQFQKSPDNIVHYNEAVSKPNLNTPLAPPPSLPSTTSVDFAQQMLTLLTKCNDVVTNLTSFLGYVPYHPL